VNLPHVAIYLPRGPIASDPSLDAQNVAELRAVLPCPIVKVNYRCRRRGFAGHAFPTPLHDAVTGYDWVYENLLAKRAISRPGRSDLVGRIAVVGELLGGSLATSLALTECKIGEPGIVAAAVSSPIVDWVAFDDEGAAEPVTNGRGEPLKVDLSLHGLLNHRRTIFRRPDAYFDPFASPSLFFRSAGIDAPPPPIGEEGPEQGSSDMDFLAQLSREESNEQDFFRSQLALDADSTPSQGSPPLTAAPLPIVKRRKASRRYPSPSLKLRLPPFHIATGGDSILKPQVAEFVRLLQKSDERQQRALDDMLAPPGSSFESDMVDYIQSPAGLGLWDSGRDGRARLSDAAQWLRMTLFHG
jgi:acetyl esterase/lipase